MKSLLKKQYILPLIAVLLIAGGSVWVYKNNNKKQEVPGATSSESSDTGGASDDSKQQTNKTTENQTDSDESGGITNPNPENQTDPQDEPGPSSSIQPTKPVGTFVSDHRPGSNMTNEHSTCSTTPGVKCQIVFTNSGQTKTLPTKTTNNNGNTGWYWKPADIGLSSGEWKVTAIASNGNKTTSSSDATNLVIP